MVIKIEKKISKTCKEYVGLWFDNWLVTIDRRAIYKIAKKEDVQKLKVGEVIFFDLYRADEDLTM